MKSYNPNFSPEWIKHLEPNQVFVFGSNENGHHIGGAAKIALDHYKAIWGQGQGIMGKSYAIPTLDVNMRQLSIEVIEQYVNQFIHDASKYPEMEFLVTKIGCGIAGRNESDIWPLFKKAGLNVRLPEQWLKLLILEKLKGES